MSASPNAIRHINPEKDLWGEGELVYPGLFYRFGLAEYPSEEEVEEEETEE